MKWSNTEPWTKCKSSSISSWNIPHIHSGFWRDVSLALLACGRCCAGDSNYSLQKLRREYHIHWKHTADYTSQHPLLWKTLVLHRCILQYYYFCTIQSRHCAKYANTNSDTQMTNCYSRSHDQMLHTSVWNGYLFCHFWLKKCMFCFLDFVIFTLSEWYKTL